MAKGGGRVLDPKTLMIGMLSMSSVMLIFIIIIFVSIRRKNQKSQKGALEKSIRESTAKRSDSGTAFYQKLYLKLATTPIIKRYLFKVRMRFELVGNDDEYNLRIATAKATFKAILITIIASGILMFINREDLFMMLVSVIRSFSCC